MGCLTSEMEMKIVNTKLKENEALLFTKGIGEVPVIQMATFSIWKNLASLKDFAYSSKGHQNAIKLTRKVDWYSEELFARFIPFKTEGSWPREDNCNTSGDN